MKKFNLVSSVKRDILRILESWGKRVIYRYLRDHKLLEAFIEQLPLKEWKITSENEVQKTLIAIWDDYSEEKLQAIRDWEQTSLEGGLGIRMARIAKALNTQGFHSAASEVLKLASHVDLVSEQVSTNKRASKILPGDMILGYSNLKGFSKEGYAGKVIKASRVEDQMKFQVHISQLDQTKEFYVPADTSIKVGSLVKPRESRALKLQALSNMIQAEKASTNSSLQAKIARLRFQLESEITMINLTS